MAQAALEETQGDVEQRNRAIAGVMILVPSPIRNHVICVNQPHQHGGSSCQHDAGPRSV